MGKTLILFFLRWTPVVVFFFLVFIFSLLFSILSHTLEYFLTHSMSLLWELALYTLAGLSFSMLASLCAWPLALTFSTLILQKKSYPIFKVIEWMAYFLSGIPILIFAYIIIEILGIHSIFGLNNLSIDILSTSNLLTQAIAFAFTILLYPFTIIPGFFENRNVDMFFHEMLNAVLQFAELGFISFIIIFVLFLYILPKMIVKMFYYLQKDENIKNYEAVLAVGGTQWESLYLSSLQAMKLNFNYFIVKFTRLCFFEGIITYSLLHFYLQDYENSWGTTLSSFYIQESMTLLNPQRVIAIGGFLIFIYGILSYIESLFSFADWEQNV